MLNLRILRVVSIVCFVVILSACTLKKATQNYQQGDYIASIKTITDRLNQKQDYPRSALKKSWLDTVHLSIHKIESLPAMSLEQKIERLEKIHQARLLVGSGFYANAFETFNQRYPMVQLKLDIAKLYYEKGNRVQLITTESYREKAEAYQTGLEFAQYADMLDLAIKYRKAYSTRLAEDFYREAQLDVKNKDYKNASQNFSKAVDAYRAYGKYKDAQALFVKYDQLWRADAAAQFMSQAASKEKSAKLKGDFRTVAKLYSEAVAVYQPYGAYKNAASLAATAKNKGMIHIAYTLDQERGEDQCGSAYHQRLSERFKTKIQDRFKSYPFTLSTSGASDVHIYIDYQTYYKAGKLEERNQVQSIVDQQGKEFKFNQRNEYRLNQYEIQIEIESKDGVRLRKRISKDAQAELDKTFYSGLVPEGYKNKTIGALKEQQELCLGVISEVEREVETVLDQIAQQSLKI
ncbi:hypothetical protein EC844_1214 [Acinetobacter calcoaceticus]|uniref:Uncharacterized protein n=1 Tax=Acinetobacter calcoaceticus TaxID=471 RepID=A0A4R1XUB7_ACICA|nr:hypothetical protein EC844_1214 [Acinetobacter calcoaceticus]